MLINNAGIQHVENVESFPTQRFKQLLDVMLTGCFTMTKTFLPDMRAGGYGRIINYGSIHSLVASPYKSAYVAAKHGLVGFSKVVALETGDCDVTCNTVRSLANGCHRALRVSSFGCTGAREAACRAGLATWRMTGDAAS